MRRVFRLLATLLLLVSPAAFASTGSINEITNLHTENCTPSGCIAVWHVAHPSTCQVVLARSNQYEPERWVPAVPDPTLTQDCRVLVDSIPWWLPGKTIYWYAAVRDASGKLSTAPGPQTPDQRNPLLPMTSLPTNQSAPTAYKIMAFGPDIVQAGDEIHWQMVSLLTAGPVADPASGGGTVWIKNYGGYNQNKDCQISWVPTPGPSIKPGNPLTIGCHWINGYGGSGTDDGDQHLDTAKGLDICYNCKTNGDMAVAFRPASNTIPGTYQAKGEVIVNGQTFQWGTDPTKPVKFTVQAPADASVVHQATDFPPIPNVDNFNTVIQQLAERWCADQDNKNQNTGFFLNQFGPFAEQNWWFYAGAGSDDNLISFFGTPNTTPRWQHCQEIFGQSYADYLNANAGQVNQYDQFPWMLANNYQRTGNVSMKTAVLALAGNSASTSFGYIDPVGMRENAYNLNNMLAAKAVSPGFSNIRFKRRFSRLLGNIAIDARQQFWPAHGFMQGQACETMKDEWEASGHTDYRVFPYAKMLLQNLKAHYYQAAYHYVAYDRYALPMPVGDLRWTTLNIMQGASCAAWYYQWTSDKEWLDFGDDLFAHALDSPGNYNNAGKEASQLAQFAFEYERSRKGLGSTRAASFNTYVGAYPDTNPPIQFKNNCDPNFFNPACQAGTIGSTTANMSFRTYKPATGQVIYGTVSGSYPNSSAVTTMTTAQQIGLRSLNASTKYYFRYVAVDAGGRKTTSREFSFTTGAGGLGGFFNDTMIRVKGLF